MHRAVRGAELNARQPLHRIAAGTAALALSAVWLGPSAAAAQPGDTGATAVTAQPGSPELTISEQEALLTAYERADRAYRSHVTALLAISTRDAAVQPPKPASPSTTANTTANPAKSAKKPATTKQPTTKKKASSGSGSGSTGSVPGPSGAAGTVVSFAMAQVGKPYVYARSGPEAYDCSGLVQAAYARAGVKLPHQSEQIAARGRKVPSGQWLPGDVIHTPGHVGIYIGGGKMVEAANPSAGVRVAAVRGGTAYRFL